MPSDVFFAGELCLPDLAVVIDCSIGAAGPGDLPKTRATWNFSWLKSTKFESTPTWCEHEETGKAVLAHSFQGFPEWKCLG